MKKALLLRLHLFIQNLKQSKSYVPALLCLFFFVLYGSLSVLRHQHFGTHAFDLSIFDQAIWHYSLFQAPASTVRGTANLLGDHFHPI